MSANVQSVPINQTSQDESNALLLQRPNRAEIRAPEVNDYRETMEQQIHSLRKLQDRDRFPLEDPENAMVHGRANVYGYWQFKNKTVTGSDSSFPPEKLEFLNCSKGSRYTTGGTERYKFCPSESSGYNIGANHSSIKQANVVKTYSCYMGKCYRNKMTYADIVKYNTWYANICVIEKKSDEYNEVIKYIKMMKPDFDDTIDNMVVTIYEELEQQGNPSLYRERVKLFKTAYTPEKIDHPFLFKTWDLSGCPIITGNEVTTEKFYITDTQLQEKHAFWTSTSICVCYYNSDHELVIEPWNENGSNPSDNFVKIKFNARAFNEKNLKLLERQGIQIGTGSIYFTRCGSLVSTPNLFGKNPGMHRYRGLYIEVCVSENDGIEPI